MVKDYPITNKESLHTGIDLVPTHYSSVVTIADGIITFARVQNDYGNCIKVKHNVNGKEIYSFYAYLSEIEVQKGDSVTQGQEIAK